MKFKKFLFFNSLDDYYFIPNNIDIEKLSTRDILAKAAIIRYIIDDGKVIQKITFKNKNIDDVFDKIKVVQKIREF